MKRFLRNLRVSERIGLGFALIVLLFFGAIGHHHLGTRRMMTELEQRQSTIENGQDALHGVYRYLLEIQVMERTFMADHASREAEKIVHTMQRLLAGIAILVRENADNAALAGKLEVLARSYVNQIREVRDAQGYMGEDENAGLRGRFREAAHALESWAIHTQATGSSGPPPGKGLPAAPPGRICADGPRLCATHSRPHPGTAGR